MHVQSVFGRLPQKLSSALLPFMRVQQCDCVLVRYLERKCGPNSNSNDITTYVCLIWTNGIHICMWVNSSTRAIYPISNYMQPCTDNIPNIKLHATETILWCNIIVWARISKQGNCCGGTVKPSQLTGAHRALDIKWECYNLLEGQACLIAASSHYWC